MISKWRPEMISSRPFPSKWRPEMISGRPFPHLIPFFCSNLTRSLPDISPQVPSSVFFPQISHRSLPRPPAALCLVRRLLSATLPRHLLLPQISIVPKFASFSALSAMRLPRPPFVRCRSDSSAVEQHRIGSLNSLQVSR